MDLDLENKQPDLFLEFCSLQDSRYREIRARHYVPSNGIHGQQIHFLIWYKGVIVGILTGGSAAFATKLRDEFFKITSQNRTKVLNGIVDNLLFRLERNEANLATRCISAWRKITASIWEDLYGCRIFGFETFIIPEIVGNKKLRDGGLYKADNWVYVGETSGNTKFHGEEGLTGGLKGKPFKRRSVPKKLIFCRWHNSYNDPIESEYKSSWRGQTVAEKELGKERARKRKEYLGKKFFVIGKKVVEFKETL